MCLRRRSSWGSKSAVALGLVVADREAREVITTEARSGRRCDSIGSYARRASFFCAEWVALALDDERSRARCFGRSGRCRRERAGLDGDGSDGAVSIGLGGVFARAHGFCAAVQGFLRSWTTDTNWVPAGSPSSDAASCGAGGSHRSAPRGSAGRRVAESHLSPRAGASGRRNDRDRLGCSAQRSRQLRLETDVGSRDSGRKYPVRSDGGLSREGLANVGSRGRRDPVAITGSTSRQHLADVSRSPMRSCESLGFPGGLSFDLSADVGARYRSVQLFFGTDADPITARQSAVLGLFRGGPFAEYNVRLDGWLEQTVSLVVHPSLYVSLAGRRWMLDSSGADPVLSRPVWRGFSLDPQRVRLELPEVQRREVVVLADFGEVLVGESREDTVPVNSGAGGMDLAVQAQMDEGSFAFPRRDAVLAPRSSTFFRGVSPMTPGSFEQRVVFRTNDPDTPEYPALLRGVGIVRAGPEPTLTDAGMLPVRSDASRDGGTGAQVGGCGCRTVPTRTYGPAWWVLAVVLVARRRSEPTPRPPPGAELGQGSRSGGSGLSVLSGFHRVFPTARCTHSPAQLRAERAGGGFNLYDPPRNAPTRRGCPARNSRTVARFFPFRSALRRDRGLPRP